jgi:coenzyme F420-reducing hydrogenase beta subunit
MVTSSEQSAQPSCAHCYTTVASMSDVQGRPGSESLPMCRLLQSMNTGTVLHEVRRLQVLSRMERAGYLSTHSDGCGFTGATHCPYFKGG